MNQIQIRELPKTRQRILLSSQVSFFSCRLLHHAAARSVSEIIRKLKFFFQFSIVLFYPSQSHEGNSTVEIFVFGRIAVALDKKFTELCLKPSLFACILILLLPIEQVERIQYEC